MIDCASGYTDNFLSKDIEKSLLRSNSLIRLNHVVRPDVAMLCILHVAQLTANTVIS